jgi:thiamine-phosphate pyrophosphorylase
VIRYLITDGSGRPELADTGVDFIQIREPRLTARQLAGAARNILSRAKARVLINDRADVAIASGAHGVHLRSNWPDVRRIRAIAPAGFIVSVACHSIGDVRRAAGEGADYALLAPIFPPISKPDSRPTLGVDAIRQASGLGVPVIALGGITEANTADCISAGAAGVAGITIFAAPAHGR